MIQLEIFYQQMDYLTIKAVPAYTPVQLFGKPSTAYLKIAHYSKQHSFYIIVVLAYDFQWAFGNTTAQSTYAVIDVGPTIHTVL